MRKLALDFPKRCPEKNLLIYLTARNPALGDAAVRRIYEDEEIKEAKVLTNDGGSVLVCFRKLDVAARGSRSSFIAHIFDLHPSIDLLFNNAGVFYEDTSKDVLFLHSEQASVPLG